MRAGYRGVLLLLSSLGALGAVAACSDLLGIVDFTAAGEDSGAPPARDGSSDSASESGSEGGPGSDAADAGSDGGSDSGADGGSDSGSDGGSDSGADGGSDSGADSGSDSGFDGGGPVITLRGYTTTSDYGVAGMQTLSRTLDWTQSPGDLIVLLINYDATLGLSQVSDTSGNVYTRFGSPTSDSDYNETMYYCLGAKAAVANANTVDVTLSAPGANGSFSVSAFGFGAPSRTWVQDQYVNDTQGDASLVVTGAVTIMYLDEVLIAGTGVRNHVVAGSGGTWIAEPVDGLGDLQEFEIVGFPVSAISATFTQNAAGPAVSQLGTFAAKP